MGGGGTCTRQGCCSGTPCASVCCMPLTAMKLQQRCRSSSCARCCEHAGLRKGCRAQQPGSQALPGAEPERLQQRQLCRNAWKQRAAQHSWQPAAQTALLPVLPLCCREKKSGVFGVAHSKSKRKMRAPEASSTGDRQHQHAAAAAARTTTPSCNSTNIAQIALVVSEQTMLSADCSPAAPDCAGAPSSS